MPQYDAKLIQRVFDKVRSLPQMTWQDADLLFPPQSYFDFIADAPVDYGEAKVVKHWFKGMMHPQPLPVSIELSSDYSQSGSEIIVSHLAPKRSRFAWLVEKLYFWKQENQEPTLAEQTLVEPRHYLTISHTLDPRASPDFATIRTYRVDQQFAEELAQLHRAFYEGQDARHVFELNQALEQRQLLPRGYSSGLSGPRRRRDGAGLAPHSHGSDDGGEPPAGMQKPLKREAKPDEIPLCTKLPRRRLKAPSEH